MKDDFPRNVKTPEKDPNAIEVVKTPKLNATYESNPIVSAIRDSHHDPVYSVKWVHTKQGSDLMSASTDGRILVWDRRTHEKDKYLLLYKKTDFKLLE